MKKPSVPDLVFHKIFPRPRPNDPTSFTVFMQRCLVPEVREEVQRFFGRIDCLEAQYPGLDYTFEPHRQRLRSFTWHRRLFRAFDELKLTTNEMLTLCNWEGTRAAKERFEREAQTKIESTTLEGIDAEPGNDGGPRAVFHTPIGRLRTRGSYGYGLGVPGKRRAEIDEESEQDESESVGVPLNLQLLAAANARDRGEPVRFDQEWEQWMKEALERNEMDLDTILETIRQGRPFPPALSDTPSATPSIHQQVTAPTDSNRPVDAALETGDEPPPRQDSPMPGASPQTYDQLHTMLDELQTNAARLETENNAMANFLSRTRTETAR